MATGAAGQRSCVAILPRARLVVSSGNGLEGRPAVEEEGGGGRWSGRAAAASLDSPAKSLLPPWVLDDDAVQARVAARGDEAPGPAAWNDIARVVTSLVALVVAGPRTDSARAEQALEALLALLRDRRLPQPCVLPEQHDFLLTHVYFGSPTTAPCGDVLLHGAVQLAEALDRGRDPAELADLLLDNAVALDAHLTAIRALDRVPDPAPARRISGAAAP